MTRPNNGKHKTHKAMAIYNPGNKGFIPAHLCESFAKHVETFGEDFGLDQAAVNKAAELFRQHSDKGEYISNIIKYPFLTLREVEQVVECVN